MKCNLQLLYGTKLLGDKMFAVFVVVPLTSNAFQQIS